MRIRHKNVFNTLQTKATEILEATPGVVDGLIPHSGFRDNEDLAALASVHVLDVAISAPNADDVLIIVDCVSPVWFEHLLVHAGLLARGDYLQLCRGGRNPLATTGDEGHGVVHRGPIIGDTGGHDSDD